jgi:mannose-1-phosphate guanylyltransferase
MITVIIAGGSGTRLWPLSTSNYPKHLLKLIGDKTLLQATYDRATSLGHIVYVVTEASHASHVREQLPDLQSDAFLIEPGRRGTAHCIVFALDVIGRTQDKDEPIAFIHSDHYIRDIDGFARSLTIAGDISRENNKVTLVGIEPTFPSTGLGYIERDGTVNNESGVYRVHSFKEKPDFETAVIYVNSGNYLWNCGYFIGSVNTFIDEINESSPELQNSVATLESVDYPSDLYND